MRHHLRDGYHVLDWPDSLALDIPHLWEAWPEIVVGRYLVNTSFDSGHLAVTDSQREQGWSQCGIHAHSPQITHSGQIPHDRFDEWLVFDEKTEVPVFETLVNHCKFTPLDYDWEEKLEAFWAQVNKLQPLHVLGENDHLYFVSRDTELVRKIQESEFFCSQ